MQYTNVSLPYHMAALFTGADVVDVVRTLVGHECLIEYSVGYPSVGCSPYGPYDEADIIFVDNGVRYQLSYDFMEFEDMTIGRVFRYEIYEL